MCIGIPMQIKEVGFGHAVCEGMGMRREVDTLLIGEQPVGSWVLVFLNSAREVLSPEDAAKISSAIRAVNMVMENGDSVSSGALDNTSIEALFADLIDREPPKPDSLLALEAEREARLQTEAGATGDSHQTTTKMAAKSLSGEI
ncbi:HypC/HybG/HupF family hydrogenase formation chaperone [Thiolapillus sp.]|uniref:HypC/HybG/HupF family hydrogenase formation chaperone n=3 Tax=Thiolapillus sp. TaxID=2017437 RepID=UPI00273A3EAC|nr:HypC/HybG/HupF family hydrogenase formation chaperone [Thiolapillus sp.]